MKRSSKLDHTLKLEAKSPVTKKLFSNLDLSKLILPLMVEQFLEFSVGLADSIMVSSVGEAAVSGVSLVDFIMALLISIFVALATGGAVIAGQYLGRSLVEESKEAANRFDPLILGLFSLFCAFYAATLNSSDSFPLYFS